MGYLRDHFDDAPVLQGLRAISYNIASGDFPSAGLTLGLLLSQRLVKHPSAEKDHAEPETGDEAWVSGSPLKRNRIKGQHTSSGLRGPIIPVNQSASHIMPIAVSPPS